MNNKNNNKQGQIPANRYDQLTQMLGRAVFPQTIAVKAYGIEPETFSAVGITKRELFAALAMASLAHAVVTTPPAEGGSLRPGWARRVAADAVELARNLDEALEITKDTER